MKINPVGVWGHGQLLAFSGVDGPTSYHDGLCLRTIGNGSEGLRMQVVLPGSLSLRLGSQPLLANDRGCDLASDHFTITTGEHTCRGAFLDAWHLLIEGPVSIDGTDPRLSVRQEDGRLLLAVSEHLNLSRIHDDLEAAISARRRWADHQATRLDLEERPAAVKALRQAKGQVYAPEGIFRQRWTTPDRWPHRGCWLWDSAFHAIGLRHCDPALAREAISAVFESQRADGMIPIRSNPDGPHRSNYTQPPTLTLAIWAVDSLAPDPAWLRSLLPKVTTYLQWDADHRNGPHGLPCWAIEANPNCRSGESGLDNASRFDAATRMEAVDFASFLALEWELLARLQQRLGENTAAEGCLQRWQSLNQAISKHLWDAHSGIFRDLDLQSGIYCPVAAVTGFLPLICGAASVEQARRLIAHLDDPATFGTPLPLPSVARNDPTYEPDMWRGPVWVNMVHLVAMGCERYGHTATASRLRMGMITEIERWHNLRGTLFEYYDGDAETPPDELLRKGRLAPEISPYHQCFHDYGWTGTLYLDMLLAREPLLPSAV